MRKCNTLSYKISGYQELHARETYLRQELAEINRVVLPDTLQSEEFSKELFGFASALSAQYPVVLRDFSQPVSDIYADFNMETYSITLSGGFADLLRYTHALETGLTNGRMVSVNFKLQKDIRTKKEELWVVNYIQFARRF